MVGQGRLVGVIIGKRKVTTRRHLLYLMVEGLQSSPVGHFTQSHTSSNIKSLTPSHMVA